MNEYKEDQESWYLDNGLENKADGAHIDKKGLGMPLLKVSKRMESPIAPKSKYQVNGVGIAQTVPKEWKGLWGNANGIVGIFSTTYDLAVTPSEHSIRGMYMT